MFGFGETANLLGLFGDDPEFRTLRNTKNKTIDEGQTSLLGDWKANRQAGQDALGDYIKRYMSGLGDAERRTGQEISALDQFYNGGMETRLGGLRARREKAVNDAANLAAMEAQRRASLSRLGNMGGSSSYDQRLRAAMLLPIRTQAAMDTVNQERADLDYLTGNQIGLAGNRQRLADALAAYGLAPVKVRQALFGSDLAGLTGLSQLDNMNNIYGVQKKTTDLDKWINFLNTQEGLTQDTVSTAASLMGSFMGMGGLGGITGMFGGGKKPTSYPDGTGPSGGAMYGGLIPGVNTGY